MATNRKYTEFAISRRVNVSSSGDYSFRVGIRGDNRALRWDGYSTFWTETAFPSFPKYVITALRAMLMDLLYAEDTIYYENDRYGGQRTKELRYHDPERVRCWAERLRQEAIMRNRALPIATCSVCGEGLFPHTGRTAGPMWIGLFATARCETCDRDVICLYDERGRFLMTHSNLGEAFRRQGDR